MAPPKTRPNDAAPVSTQETVVSRIYRSNRKPQQVRFPNRRKVVRKYGRLDATLSPKQRTLTQIGYTVPPLPGLHEIDLLSQELKADTSGDGRSISLLAGRWEANNGSPPPHGYRQNKRRTAHHETAGSAPAKTPRHTQTLTQLVSKHTFLGPDGDDNGCELDTMIRDSEDEDILVSLSPDAKPKQPSLSSQQHVGGRGMTSPKQQTDTFRAISNPLPFTPTSTRTEIPSSQPSPFTPMWPFDYPHSPTDYQCPSPLSRKRQRSASPTTRGPATQILVAKDIGATNASKRLKTAMPDSPSVADPPDRSQPVTRAFALTETAKRPRRPKSNRSGMPAATANGLSPGPMNESYSGFAPKRESLEGGRPHMSASEEIPDSDDEGGGFSGSYSLKQSAMSATQPAGQLSDQHGGDNGSLPSSSPLSHPRSAKPASPTPRPKTRRTTSADTTFRGVIEKVVAQRSPLCETLNTLTNRSSMPTIRDSSVRQQNNTGVHFQPLDQQHETIPVNNQQDAGLPEDTQQQYSQALESQRVPLETIRSFGPQTDRSDIIIPIHPEQIRKIVSGTKDHEFRNFKIPHTVSRFWMYATRPVYELQYMAVVAAGFRQPGDIDSDSGVGNTEFNAGRLVAKFAYKLVQVYQLNNPVSLDVMKTNGWAGPPRRYDYLPPAVVGSLLGNLRCALFEDVARPGVETRDDARESNEARGEHGKMSISQEIEAQLLSDVVEIQASRKWQHPVLSSSQGQPAAPAACQSLKPWTEQPFPVVIPPDESQVRGPALASSTPNATWPSQATTATTASTQETSSGFRSRMQDTSANVAATAWLPDDRRATVSRPTLDLDAPSVPVKKDVASEAKNAPCACAHTGMEAGLGSSNVERSPARRLARGSQKKPRVQRQRPSFQTAMASSSDLTQAALPDSLYEEVRQAPPVVIVDSEESDGE